MRFRCRACGRGFSQQSFAVSYYLKRPELTVPIAQGVVKFTKSKRLRSRYLEYDRTMLSGDPRRKEPKKFGGPGARRRKQKSYR